MLRKYNVRNYVIIPKLRKAQSERDSHSKNRNCYCSRNGTGNDQLKGKQFFDLSKNQFRAIKHFCLLYSDPTISRHLLYRGISISRELSSTAPPSDYLRSRQMSNSHFQQKLCKISRILVSKFITLQNSCRKRVFAQTGYTLPIKCLLSTPNIHSFYFFKLQSVD